MKSPGLRQAGHGPRVSGGLSVGSSPHQWGWEPGGASLCPRGPGLTGHFVSRRSASGQGEAGLLSWPSSVPAVDGASSPSTAALAVRSGLPGARALLSVSGRRLLGAQPGSVGSEVQGVVAWWVCSLMLSSARAPDLHLLRFFAWFYIELFSLLHCTDF